MVGVCVAAVLSMFTTTAASAAEVDVKLVREIAGSADTEKFDDISGVYADNQGIHVIAERGQLFRHRDGKTTMPAVPRYKQNFMMKARTCRWIKPDFLRLAAQRDHVLSGLEVNRVGLCALRRNDRRQAEQ